EDLTVQDLQSLVLHLVAAGELLHEQMAVRAQQHVLRAQLPGLAQPLASGRVLGDVVGGLPDPLGDLGQDRSVGRGDERADAGGAGVPARRAVAVDDYVIRIRRQCSHLLIPSAFFSRATSTEDSVWWQPWHVPSTSLATATPRFEARSSSYSSSSSA